MTPDKARMAQEIRKPQLPATYSTPAPTKATPRRADRVLYPLLVAVVLLGAWQGAVTAWEIPPYLVPSPLLVLQTLMADGAVLGAALLFTLKITLLSFAVAVVLGVGMVVRVVD